MTHTTVGKSHAIALALGAAVDDPRDMATRRVLFKIYRYLLLVNLLNYCHTAEGQ